MGVTGIAIEVSTTCGRCQAPLPLNGASESVLCDKCQTPNETPHEFWGRLLGDAVGEAVGFGANEARPATIIMDGRTVKLLVGKQDARCACKEPYNPEAFERAAVGGKLFCTSCGKQGTARRAPDWFKAIHPAATYLVGETMAATVAKGVAPSDLRFHCYHCGAPLPIDGSSRSVNCGHCSASVMVPDDIWVRLHPARTVDRWFAVLALDLANAKGMLPEDVSDFCDVAVEPGGNVIVAYLANGRGDAGHPARIALVQPSGALSWLQDGIEFSDDMRLVTSPVDGTCFLVDKEKGFVRAIDPRTGDPIRTLPSPAEDDEEELWLDVRDVRSIAIDWDGSFLVSRSWRHFRGLRRFAPDGRHVPTWPGMRLGEGEKGDEIEWTSWPRKHPTRLPSDVRVGVGWDGAVYFVAREGVAKYTRDGQLVGVLPFPPKLLYGFDGFTVARDGTMALLFQHETEIDDSHWAHVMKISPNGQVSIAMGPHAPHSPLIGHYANRIKGAPDGTLILASNVDCLRVVSPNGSVAWMTNGTRRDEEYEAKKLEQARRGKKLVADRV